MLFIDLTCDKCKHRRENIDGWNCACDAFPEGIPNSLLFYGEPKELSECNNGIKFEPIEGEETPKKDTE